MHISEDIRIEVVKATDGPVDGVPDGKKAAELLNANFGYLSDTKVACNDAEVRFMAGHVEGEAVHSLTWDKPLFCRYPAQLSPCMHIHLCIHSSAAESWQSCNPLIVHVYQDLVEAALTQLMLDC